MSALQARQAWSSEWTAAPRSKKGWPSALPVAVEQDRLLGHGLRVRTAAQSRSGMLPALAVAGVIGEGPVGLGHAGLVLPDAPSHLRRRDGAQPFRDLRGRPPCRRSRFGDAPGCRPAGRRVLQDVAPVLGLEPGVIVPNGGSMNLVTRGVPPEPWALAGADAAEGVRVSWIVPRMENLSLARRCCCVNCLTWRGEVAEATGNPGDWPVPRLKGVDLLG